MSSNNDYINHPTIQFVEYIANNIIGEFRSSPGMDMKSLVSILSIKYGSNPTAGAFAASVKNQRDRVNDSVPSGSSLRSNNYDNRDQRYDARGKDNRYDQRVRDEQRPVSQRSTTPSRDTRPTKVSSHREERGREKTRDDRSVREPSVGRNGPSRDIQKRSSTPARPSRDSYNDRDDDTRSVISSKSEKGRSRANSVARPNSSDKEKKDSRIKQEKPKHSIDGFKSYLTEQEHIIKVQIPGIPDNKISEEAKRRWIYLNDSERDLYAKRQEEYEKEMAATKAAAKSAEKDGFRIFSNDNYGIVSAEYGLFDPAKIKIELNKRWKVLSAEQREVYAERQKNHDDQVVASINAKIASGAWPQLSDKMINDMKALRPGQLYMASFSAAATPNPQLKMIIISMDYYIQANLYLGIPGYTNYLSVNNQNVTPLSNLDTLIQAIMDQTKIDIRKMANLLNSDARAEWSKFLKSETVKSFGYTPLPEQKSVVQVAVEPQISTEITTPRSPSAVFVPSTMSAFPVPVGFSPALEGFQPTGGSFSQGFTGGSL